MRRYEQETHSWCKGDHKSGGIQADRDMESVCIIGKRGMIMEKPVLSPNFTIEDIHKLREYNYEMTKHMTDEERMDYYNKRGREVQRKLEKMKVL